MKLTAVLMVEEIESSVPFWKDRLGFRVANEVPEAGRLGFVILAKDGAEIMLQTIASVRQDVPAFLPDSLSPNVAFFLEVDDFASAVERLGNYPISMPERTTFYGMREIGVRAPSGHPVILGAKVES